MPKNEVQTGRRRDAGLERARCSDRKETQGGRRASYAESGVKATRVSCRKKSPVQISSGESSARIAHKEHGMCLGEDEHISPLLRSLSLSRSRLLRVNQFCFFTQPL